MSIPMQLVSFVSCYMCCFVLCCVRVWSLNFNPYKKNFSESQFYYYSHYLLGFASFCGCDLCFLSVANYKFQLVSECSRVRDFQWRKTIFTWIKKQKANFAHLQETYSFSLKGKLHGSFSGEVKCFFALGTNHSRGVLILFSGYSFRSTLKR